MSSKICVNAQSCKGAKWICVLLPQQREEHMSKQQSRVSSGHIYVKEEKNNVPDFALQSKNLRAEFGFDVDALSPGTLAGLAVT